MNAKRNHMWGWIILAATAVLASTAAQADPIQLQAYTGVVGGSNECQGGGPPTVTHFFSTLGNFGLGAGGNGISDCGLAGSVINVGVGATPANSQTNLNNAPYLGANGSYSGAATASTNFGSLTVSADGSLTGPEPANGVAESIGLAIADDAINIPAGYGRIS